MILTDDKVREITCQITDKILEELIPDEKKRTIYEPNSGYTVYTDMAEELFNKWYDIIRKTIKGEMKWEKYWTRYLGLNLYSIAMVDTIKYQE